MEQPATDETTLQGAHVLVVEDDLLISMEISSVLADAGADVVGPSRTVAEALDLIDREDISAAILDVRLGQETAAPVARSLSQRQIPFFFYTGQVTNDPIWGEWPMSKVVSKPATPQTLVVAVASLTQPPRERCDRRAY
jgi:DNA-binding response OmpR family regulator